MSEAVEPRPAASKAGSLFVPCLTVFLSSCCIMVIELVAGRIIARFLGSSLYTWTSVIGVVLAGITIGNYIGGRLADRYPSRRTLAVLFVLSSVASVLAIIANNLVGEWMFLWRFNWPMRIFSHVTLVFLLPSLLLGTISPVVAKMALDQGRATGRTVGAVYAWGAGGSIAGTFATGYWLIPTLGTTTIVWTVAGFLLLMALFYGPWSKVAHAWAVLLGASLLMGMLPADWAESAGATLALRREPNPFVLYEAESQYNHVFVERISDFPDKRIFIQDDLLHSVIVVDNPTDLQYSYEHIFAAVTHRYARNEDNLSFLCLGGGGYVFPRYLETFWPESNVEVVEIDPTVTEAAHAAFGLARDTSIRTISLDARNYIHELVERQRLGQEVPKYDLIYGDVFNHYTVPFQLTTYEFSKKLAPLLKDDGIYIMNLIDLYQSGRFLCSMVHTLQQTFAYVYVFAEFDLAAPPEQRQTFVLVAAKNALNLDNVVEDYRPGLSFTRFGDAELAALQSRIPCTFLTDDRAPVENLLAPVVRARSKTARAEIEVRDRSEEFLQARRRAAEGDIEGVLQYVEPMVRNMTDKSVEACTTVANVFARAKNFDGALAVQQHALRLHQQLRPQVNLAGLHYDFAYTLSDAGRTEEAFEQLALAEQGYLKLLEADPNNETANLRLGSIAAVHSQWPRAIQNFQKTLEINPDQTQALFMLLQILLREGQTAQARQLLRNALNHHRSRRHQQTVQRLEQFLSALDQPTR